MSTLIYKLHFVNVIAYNSSMNHFFLTKLRTAGFVLSLCRMDITKGNSERIIFFIYFLMNVVTWLSEASVPLSM